MSVALGTAAVPYTYGEYHHGINPFTPGKNIEGSKTERVLAYLTNIAAFSALPRLKGMSPAKRMLTVGAVPFSSPGISTVGKGFRGINSISEGVKKITAPTTAGTGADATIKTFPERLQDLLRAAEDTTTNAAATTAGSVGGVEALTNAANAVSTLTASLQPKPGEPTTKELITSMGRDLIDNLGQPTGLESLADLDVKAINESLAALAAKAGAINTDQINANSATVGNILNKVEAAPGRTMDFAKRNAVPIAAGGAGLIGLLLLMSTMKDRRRRKEEEERRKRDLSRYGRRWGDK